MRSPSAGSEILIFRSPAAAARSAVPGAPSEISLYANEGYYEGASASIRRYTIRLDGFVSIHAPMAGGEVVTTPIVFEGNELVVNCSTSAAGSLRVEDQPFAVVPEWVIDTQISDAAFRVYSLLLRYGNTSGQRMPSRKLLAVRLHRSVDAVDRAVRELADAGLLRVEHRRAGRRNLTNRYHLTTRPPHGPDDGGGRRSAPTPGEQSQAGAGDRVGGTAGGQTGSCHG